LANNVSDSFGKEDKNYQARSKPRFIVRDLEGNPKFIIEDLDPQSNLSDLVEKRLPSTNEREREAIIKEHTDDLKKHLEFHKIGADSYRLAAPPENSLNNYMKEFPADVRAFVGKLNLQQGSLQQLDSTVSHIRTYLEEQNVKYDISPTLFTDPEYPDWQEIELKIRIRQSLKFIYENFKSKIYELVRQHAPEELLDKILIDFESF
jgi:hypothetical protein